MRLLGVGVASALVWAVLVVWVPLLPTNLQVPLLDLGKITGYGWASAALYLLIVLSLHALYLVGYRAIVRPDGRVKTWHVFAIGGVLCAELLWAYPATAVDVFGYIAQGRVLVLHHANPLIVAPYAFPTDDLIPFVAFPEEPSQYGPMWALVGGAVTSIGRANLLVEVLLYKALGAAALIGGAGLVLVIARRLGAGPRQARACAYVYVCNPLLLWEMVANAHNDAFMMLLGLAAVWLWLARLDLAVMPALAAGALVKVPIALIAPLLFIALWRRSRTQAIASTLLALALVVLVYRPFWAGPSTIAVLQRGDLFTASIGEILRLALVPGLGVDLATTVAATVSRTAFSVVAVLAVLYAAAAEDDRAIVGAGYIMLLAGVFLATTWFQAWYIVWPIAFGLALARPRWHLAAGLLSLGGLFQYFVFIYLWGTLFPPREDLGVESFAVLAIIGPLLIGILLGQIKVWRHSLSPLAAS